MCNSIPRDSGDRRYSRRTILHAMGGAGIGVILAACGSKGGSTTSGDITPTNTGRAAEKTAASPTVKHTMAAASPSVGKPDASVIRIPDTGAKLPTDKVTLRWMSGGPGAKSFFFKAFFRAYEKAHPNITIQYDELPNDKIQEVLPLGLRNGNVDDVFQNVGLPLSEAVNAGWVAALDDIVPNFSEWKQNFPFGTLVPGVQIFNGKTYGMPANSSRRYGTMLLYNKKYLDKTGYDPSSKPFTWDEFRAAARKLTKQGKGQYYGFITGGKQVGSLGGMIANVAQMAGALGGGFNWKTGEYDYAADEFIATIDLFLAMKSDGSFFPGWLSLSEQEARARMPQEASAMMLQGAWNFPVWNQQNPDFRYGVASQPVPNDRKPMPLTYAVGGANQYCVYVNSKRKAVAGDMLHYIGTKEGQKAWALLDGAADPAWSPEAIQEARQSSSLDPHTRKAFDLYDKQVRLAPSPLIRNPDNAQVELEMKAVHPNLGEVVQGIMTGQVSDTRQALKDLSNRSEKALDDAIAAAKKKGAKVSRDDRKFPNWDPTKDYTEEDYKQFRK